MLVCVQGPVYGTSKYLAMVGVTGHNIYVHARACRLCSNYIYIYIIYIYTSAGSVTVGYQAQQVMDMIKPAADVAVLGPDAMLHLWALQLQEGNVDQGCKSAL